MIMFGVLKRSEENQVSGWRGGNNMSVDEDGT
jgi:hypothetical protein